MNSKETCIMLERINEPPSVGGLKDKATDF